MLENSSAEGRRPWPMRRFGAAEQPPEARSSLSPSAALGVAPMRARRADLPLALELFRAVWLRTVREHPKPVLEQPQARADCLPSSNRSPIRCLLVQVQAREQRPV